MGTSSARPDNLDTFVRHSRAGDDALESYRALLADRIDRFTMNSRWATFQAGSLMNGFAAFIDLNGDDAAWVAQIASAFRVAGANGVLNVPDAAIEASLRAVGLDHGRAQLVYSDPIAFGMPATTGYANDPVNTAIGNFVEVETDLRFTGLLATLSFTRTYNSCSDRGGPFGPRWSSWATTRLTPVPDGIQYEGPDGQRAHFPREGQGFGRVAGVNALVERRPDGFDLAWFGGAVWSFDAAGRPVEVTTGPGTAVRFTYDDGRLVALVHERGRRVDVRWSDDRIVAAVASDGREATYRYADGDLVEASGDAGLRTYGIDGAGLIGSVTDADGVVELVNTYDEHGRVATQLSPFGRRTSFGYLPGNVTVTADDSGGPTNTFVHDRSGRLTAAIDGHDETFRRHYDEWGNPVAIIERDGAVTVQEWDERARLLRRTLPSGAELAYTYDDADRVLSVTTSDGGQTRFSYAGAERIPAEVVDPEGGVTRLAVVDGVVREIVDPDGVVVVLRHDADGNVVEVIDAEGGVGVIERDVAGRPLAAVSPAGRRTQFGYDQRGFLATRTGPDGAVWRYEHSRVGRPTAAIDPLGARTELVYGEHGEVAEIVDALGARTLQQYDALGNLTVRTGPDGGKWTWTYDGLCRLSSTTDPAGATWLREYDVVGNLIGSIDPMGIHRTATFDQAGAVTSVSDGLTTVEFTSDAFGRPTAQLRPDGTALRATYDRCGRRVTVTEPGGGTWRTDYSPAGRIRRVVSAAGREEHFEYDRCGRLAATVDGTGARWQLRRDADGAVVASVWPTGDVEQFAYDAAGRLLRRTGPGGGTTTYGYDACGRVTSVTDATGGVRGFARDALGRIVAATDANGGTVSYAYDVAGGLVHVTDALGGRTTRTYDEMGRLLTETDPLDRTTTFAYDAAGRLLQRTDPARGRVHWTYDTAGRVRDIRGAGATESIWVERDELGRPVAYVEPGRSRAELRWTPDGTLAERRRGDLALSWTYDLDGLRTALRLPDGSSMTYDRDGAGRTVAVEHPILGRVHTDRDAAGRLVGVRGADLDATWVYSDGALVAYEVRQGTERRSTRYERDAAGRVLELTTDGVSRRFGHDAAGQLVTDDGPEGRRKFSYDAAGRLTNETGPWPGTWSYDAAGQLVSAGGRTFGYDAAGRRIEERDGDTVRSYGWDWLGRPTGVRTASPSGVDETRLLVDAIGELAEIDGKAVLWDTADPFSPPAWLDGAPVLAVGPLRARPGAGSPWLDTDGPGVGGDPWGSAGAVPAIGYRGELCVGGLVWLRDRMYDPATRAFLTPDPLPPVPGTAYAGNVYHYAGNDPIDLIDPLGRRPLTEADFQAYRDGVAGGAIAGAEHWLENNWEYVAGAALIVAGVVVIVMSDGTLAPVGGGLIDAGIDTIEQKAEKGKVNWWEVGATGVVGTVTAYAGGAPEAQLINKGADVVITKVAGGAVTNVVAGTIERPIQGKSILDPEDMVYDAVGGGVGGALDARFGGPEPKLIEVPSLHKGPLSPRQLVPLADPAISHLPDVPGLSPVLPIDPRMLVVSGAGAW